MAIEKFTYFVQNAVNVDDVHIYFVMLWKKMPKGYEKWQRYSSSISLVCVNWRRENCSGGFSSFSIVCPASSKSVVVIEKSN